MFCRHCGVKLIKFREVKERDRYSMRDGDLIIGNIHSWYKCPNKKWFWDCHTVGEDDSRIYNGMSQLY